MSKNIKNGTFIHGIAASEHLDSSGERIIIEGVDISSLTKDGVINWEHKSDSASSIVGKILEAKKIFKADDCENEYHEYFWDKVRMPFIYIAAELFDHVGHSAAQDVAAMLKYDKNLNKDETKALINFSIEGSRLGKNGSDITKCIARKVTATITPCNKMAHAEQMEKPSKSTKTLGGIDISREILSKFKKTEEIQIELLKSIPKYYSQFHNKEKSKLNPKNKPGGKANYKPAAPMSGAKPSKTSELKMPKPKREFTSQNAPNTTRAGDRVTYRQDKPRTGAQIYNDPKTWEKSENKSKHKEKMKIDLMKKKKKRSFYTSNVRKALTASCGVGAPSTLSDGAALQKENIYKKGMSRLIRRSDILKNLSNNAWNSFKNKDKLIEIIQIKNPKLSKNEVLAIAKATSYLMQKKQETNLQSLVPNYDMKENFKTPGSGSANAKVPKEPVMKSKKNKKNKNERKN